MSAIDATEKQCKECGQMLPTTEFYQGKQRGNNGQVWNYYDSICKGCRVANQTNRRREIKAQAVEYLGGKCAICNQVYPQCVYDFHHKDLSNKDYSISVNAKSFETMKPELDKCILICSNCHRVVHDM